MGNSGNRLLKITEKYNNAENLKVRDHHEDKIIIQTIKNEYEYYGYAMLEWN